MVPSARYLPFVLCTMHYMTVSYTTRRDSIHNRLVAERDGLGRQRTGPREPGP
jgi:hypothetical protein